ncbi:carbon storage regulator CsrA [Paenibacillus daejeonensis]|uniref:carbon storage regulator CsrA n=1 Tax=Paenibacillus daejeonensis TaxID=135193 RepID=UPI0003776739|nr:carbon storage regulator CsrA [Paenibacillus daejeonensis]
MLVLSRKREESIIIDGEIEVVVLGVEGDAVKLGIRAPRNVDIYRKEIYTAIQAANRDAVTASIPLSQLTELFKGKEKGERKME